MNVSHDLPHLEANSDEWLSTADRDASDEFAAINGFCRTLLLGILALGLFFVASVAYLAVVHAAA
jgi:hypothetical protein